MERYQKTNLLIKVSVQFPHYLFAGLSYNKLIKNHFKHHKNPGEEDDPDFYTKSQNFFIWWGTFLWRYTTITQLIIMAVVFNVLKSGLMKYL
ncbi:MAG: hypothetical protein MZV64_01025 [Ignavibacteriales bacterium]|nr:hypothetical protein [Ignavibacteriales bacterium]